MPSAEMHNYVCQRAAHAIISEIGEYRVSSDALQVINQFLDEFLARLLSKSQSLDLSLIKAAVNALLPSTLGRNAIVEAELEVKNYTENEVVDHHGYELNRALGTNAAFPLDAALPLLKDKAADFCTLADRDKAVSTRANPLNGRDIIEISPIVVIYATTVLEHVAEYILTAITMAVENEDTYNIRIKDVFLALDADEHVGNLFRQMDLREKIEKRVLPNNVPLSRSLTAPKQVTRKQSYIRSSTLTTATSPSTPTGLTTDYAKNFAIEFDFEETTSDADLTEQDDGAVFPSKASTVSPNVMMSAANSNYSVKSQNSQTFRPHSVLTSSSSNATLSTGNSVGSTSKKRFNIFKKDRISLNIEDENGHLDAPVYDPDSSTMTFEDVIRSSGTVRVSLTPNRLKSIEIKDPLAEDPPSGRRLSWERRSQSTPRISVTIPPRSQTPTPSSRLPTPNQTDINYENSFRDLPPQPYATRSQSPLTISSNKSSLVDLKASEAATRFENPREAPKPPSTVVMTVDVPLTPQSSTSSSRSKTRQYLPSSSNSTSSNEKHEKSLKTPSASLPHLPPAPYRGNPPAPMRADSTPTPSVSADYSKSMRLHKRQGPTVKNNKSVPDLRAEDDRKARSSADMLDIPERPSSVAAKRASMAGSPRHETFPEAAVQLRRLSTAGSVGMSIKAWDDIVKQNAGRLGNKNRTTAPSSQIPADEDNSDSSSNHSGSEDNAGNAARVQRKPMESRVLDKVLKFERAQSSDDVTLRPKVNSMYLPREPPVLERNKSMKALPSNTGTPMLRGTRVDAAVQTESNSKSEVLVEEDEEDEDKAESVAGLVDGDEEWFLQDEDWDDVPEQELAVVEWLLGEA